MLYLRASSYRVVIVHTEPSAHAISENGYYVPLTQNNTTLADDLRRPCTTVKPKETNIKPLLVTLSTIKIQLHGV